MDLSGVRERWARACSEWHDDAEALDAEADDAEALDMPASGH